MTTSHMQGSENLFAGAEFGGTKVVCALASAQPRMFERDELPTAGPRETLQQVLLLLESYRARHGPWRAVGFASFGPLRLDRHAPDFGCIVSSPKSGWNGVNLDASLRSAAGNAPYGLDTDVGAAALAEWKWGSAQGCESVVYLTVGTGIGGGILIRGRPLHGKIHPELGHISVERAPHDSYTGACMYHGACLEGLASGPAILKRFGGRLMDFPADHPAVRMEACYLGQLVANVAMTVAPERIVLGGGVMDHPALLPLVREEAARRLNGYGQFAAAASGLDRYIVPPALRGNAGVLGAVALAIDALARRGQCESGR